MYDTFCFYVLRVGGSLRTLVYFVLFTMKSKNKPRSVKFPYDLNRARQSLDNKCQKRIFALALYGLHAQKKRLYKSEFGVDPDSIDYNDADAANHFRNYIPDRDSVERKITFGRDFLVEFSGLAYGSLETTMRKGAMEIAGKSFIFKSEDSSGSMSPIYTCKYHKVKGLMMRINEDCVIPMIDHSSGYSSIDLVLWGELESTHSMRCLEILSGYSKYPVMPRRKLDDFRNQLNADYHRYESEDHIKECAMLPDLYDISGAFVGSVIRDSKGNALRKYPKMPDFKSRVLDKAFGEIISKSRGAWVATDDDGKGYRLVKTGSKYTHIDLCMAYDPSAVVLPKSLSSDCLAEKDNEGQDDRPEINKEQLFVKEFGKQLFEHIKKSGLAEKFAVPSLDDLANFEVSEEHLALIEQKKAERQARMREAEQQFTVDRFTHDRLDFWFLTRAENPDSLNPITLVISDVEVTRTIRDDGESVFIYEFCGDKWVVEPSSAPRVFTD